MLAFDMWSGEATLYVLCAELSGLGQLVQATDSTFYNGHGTDGFELQIEIGLDDGIEYVWSWGTPGEPLVEQSRASLSTLLTRDVGDRLGAHAEALTAVHGGRHPSGGFDHGAAEPSARLTGETLDRATDRQRCHHRTVAAHHRGADRGDARFPLADALDPLGPARLARQHPTGRTDVERQQRPLRHDPPQTVGRLERQHAASLISLTDEELHALTRVVAELLEHRPSELDEREPCGGCLAECDETQPEVEAAVGIAPQEPVRLQRGGQAMRGRAREAGRRLQLAQRAGGGGDGLHHQHGLVEHADARYAVHIARSLSHMLGCQQGVVTMGKTLPEKVWERHLVHSAPNEPDLLYIDLHLVHEVTSPQAFDGLRLTGRTVRRPELTIATEDHNVPTEHIDQPIADPISAKQIDTLRANTAEFGITNFPMGDPNQGIVHVIGPEQGRTLPGMTIVCGDSHTATHGAFGALAFGIGTSEVEHVLATQTLPQQRPKWMSVTVEGELQPGVTAKDVILAILGEIGTGGGIGHVIEYRGSAIRALSMEGRMTVCNMSIEAGAKAGMIAPDETTFDYLRGRANAPSGDDWDAAVADWSTLRSDDDAVWDKEVVLDAAAIRPHVTWGTNPGQVAPIDSVVPSPDDYDNPTTKETVARALEYMGLEPGTPMRDVAVDTVFIGSCTNSRIEDLRAAAAVMEGRTVTVPRVMVVPGSHAVKAQAIEEGLDQIFIAAGADWREPGCSMCLAMNPDKLAPGERAASTSNRNFEGRQGRGGRTHLVSPGVAAATAVKGTFCTPADLEGAAS